MLLPELRRRCPLSVVWCRQISDPDRVLKLASFDAYFGPKTIQKTLGDGHDPFDFSLGSPTGKINATASTLSLGRILDLYARISD